MSNENPRRKDYHIGDHLANQRTFLAWLRTSLGLIAFGFVVERFALFSSQLQQWLQKINGSQTLIIHHPYESTVTGLGLFLIVCGASVSVFAFYKYMRLEKQIKEETYAPSHLLEGSLTLLLFFCGVFLTLYLSYS
jgi:putative membrane protein